jgi:hypothetical protein
MASKRRTPLPLIPKRSKYLLRSTSLAFYLSSNLDAKFSTTLHWLLSQSLFLVRIHGVDAYGNINDDDRLTRLEYSVTGTISALAVQSWEPLSQYCWGFSRSSRRVLETAAIASSASSLVLLARPEPGISMRKVRWGDIAEADEGKKGVRHCGFTCGIASEPLEGSLYRGRKEWQIAQGQSFIAKIIEGDGLLVLVETG